LCPLLNIPDHRVPSKVQRTADKNPAYPAQTNVKELAVGQVDAIESLPANQKRLYRRAELSGQNQQLAAAARQSGVITPTAFSTFQNQGYQGLCGIR